MSFIEFSEDCYAFARADGPNNCNCQRQVSRTFQFHIRDFRPVNISIPTTLPLGVQSSDWHHHVAGGGSELVVSLSIV